MLLPLFQITLSVEKYWDYLKNERKNILNVNKGKQLRKMIGIFDL